jgi:ABC-2 type transport system permease protein
MNNLMIETHPNTMSLSRTLRAYTIEAKYAFLSVLRTPVMPITMMALPVFLYLLLAFTVVGNIVAEVPTAAVSFFSGFLIFAMVGPGFFGFGVGLAVERQSGILNLKRAQPMPPASCLVAKMITAVVCSGLTMAFLIPAAMIFGHLYLATGQIVNVVLISMFGVLPFCAIGFFIGTLVSGTASIGIVNLIFFPMLYLSGMFIPLPGILEPWARIWPTFHINQILLNSLGVESRIDIRICFLILLGITVIFTYLAARRFARKG